MGQWLNGIQDGFGKSFFNNGNKYEGEYKDGFKHGKGTFTVQVRRWNDQVLVSSLSLFRVAVGVYYMVRK